MASKTEPQSTFWGRFLSSIFTTTVSALAAFMAALLAHPQVEEAAAKVTVAGINMLLDQPDIAERITDKLGDKNDTLARKAGEEFPHLVGNFVKGVMNGTKKDDDPTNKEDDEAMKMVDDDAPPAILEEETYEKKKDA
jgi:hypothetical protein